jgi:hypothetical protein
MLRVTESSAPCPFPAAWLSFPILSWSTCVRLFLSNFVATDKKACDTVSESVSTGTLENAGHKYQIRLFGASITRATRLFERQYRGLPYCTQSLVQEGDLVRQ